MLVLKLDEVEGSVVREVIRQSLDEQSLKGRKE